MGCHGNHAISNNQMGVLLRNIEYFTLSCLIEPFEKSKQCSIGIQCSLWGSSLCNGFVLTFKVFINFHEYANEIISI